MKKTTLSLLISALGAAGLPAWADAELSAVVVTAAPAAEEQSYRRTDSSTATKVAAPLRDIPQTVDVVPAQVLKDRNATSLQDALENVPGVSFSVGDGQRDQVSIRGFSAINDQYVDGVRDDALYFRDLSNIERVEVLKGPASVLYGRGSSGGLINRVTKKPTADPVQELAVIVGQYDKKRASFDLGSAGHTARVRVTGAWEDSGGFRDQYFLERTAIAPSVAFDLGAATTLLLQTDYLKDKRLADQGVPGYKGKPVDVPIETYYGSARGRDQAFVASEVSSATATLDHRFESGLTLHNVLRAYGYSLDRNYTVIGKVDEVANTVTIDRTRRVRDEEGVFNQLELSHTVATGAIEHKLLYGLEVARQDKAEVLWSLKKAASYDLFDPQLAVLPEIPPGKPSNDNRTDIELGALYLQDLLSFGERWKVLAGVRFDHLRQTRDDKTAKNVDLQRTDNTWSPRLGVVYQPTHGVSLYASASQSFQPIADSFVFKTNSDQLAPEETLNYELGSKIELFNNAALTASVFQMTRSNIQAADPGNANLALAVGEQRTRGFELSLAGALTPQWDVLLGYAFLDSEITQSTEIITKTGEPFQGKRGALTPRNAVNLFVKRKLAGGFNVNGGLRYEGARYASPDNLVELPGYTRFDVGAGYTGKGLEVAFTLKNVFDRKYYVSAHSAANDYNMPGAPRTAELSARWFF